MSNQYKDDVIDLTSSFILADHSELENIIIELDSDDSFIVPCQVDNKEYKSSKTDKFRQNALKSSKNIKEKNSNRIGDCPICWDELGINPLAATKCGHVFCFECLERTLRTKKQCPTCRLELKGKSAYHPLYLSKY